MKPNDDLISRAALRHDMYEEAFMKDSNMQKWDSGCYIRYKLFERVVDRQQRQYSRKKKSQLIK